ncbi:hypothetical protein C8R31_101725 [Nitrosospira sp. Nsp2]|nr:hypothetical protein C8R31_101725 [Nitrosospira sp. Nsp2]
MSSCDFRRGTALHAFVTALLLHSVDLIFLSDKLFTAGVLW